MSDPLNLSLPNYRDLLVDPPGITDPANFIDNYLQLVQLHANTARRDGDEAVALILEGIVKRTPAVLSEGGLTLQDAFRASRILGRPILITDEKGETSHVSVGLDTEMSLDMRKITEGYGGVLDGARDMIISSANRSHTVFVDIESDWPPNWAEYNPYPYDYRGKYQHAHKGRKPKRGLGARRVKHVALVKGHHLPIEQLLANMRSKKTRRLRSGWVFRHSVNKKGVVIRDVIPDDNIAYNFRKRTGYYRGGLATGVTCTEYPLTGNS